jgi:hypothetical protein
VKWADGTESWIPLKDLKESHPIETAKFAKARSIADEPAFAWWVPYTLRKRDIINTSKTILKMEPVLKRETIEK